MPGSDDVVAKAAHFVGHSEDGTTLHFASTTTPEEDTRPTIIVLPPNKVVPIVFVPGIMGSNLKAKQNIKDRMDRTVVRANAPVWRVDSAGSLLSWFAKSADEAQLRLRHDQVAVDDDGVITTNEFLVFRRHHTPMAHLSEDQARKRGWGEVSAMFYLQFLDWLEHRLNFASKDFTREGAPDNPVLRSLKQIHTGGHPLGSVQGLTPPLSEADLDRLLSYHNPVHAFGYNWLQSNAKSGEELKKRIETIIQGYKDQGKQCDQVILITHSMGGLVARAASKLHGIEDKVAGVFHGVMPTDGAAGAYKRMVAGFAGEGGGLMGWVSAKILGPTGHFVTPAFAHNAGPLELLPNSLYNEGKPWLIVRDPAEKKLALPTNKDPYSEIYTEEKAWWRPCNEQWLNPAGLAMSNPFEEYGKAVRLAGKFHKNLHEAGDFHQHTHGHYGCDDKEHLAYGTVTWTLHSVLNEEQYAALRRRDLGHAGMEFMLSVGEGDKAKKVRVTMSKADVAGDGTVPAAASARRIEQAFNPAIVRIAPTAGFLPTPAIPQSINLIVGGTGYAHDSSYAPFSSSEGPRAAVHAVLLILRRLSVDGS